MPYHNFQTTQQLPFIMTRIIARFSALLLLAAGILSLDAQSTLAQNVVPAPDPPASPLAVAKTMLSDGTYAAVYYSSPRRRGREIFGGLVPLGRVWRLGANHATEITLTQDVHFGGMPLEAGTYALFAIPNESEWTVIVNGVLNQWGAFAYSEEHDVLRVDVPIETTDDQHEAFAIALEAGEDESSAALTMTWDHTQVSVPIESVE